MISMLAPSRKRPEWFARMLASVVNTASDVSSLEVVVYLDDDDPTRQQYKAFAPSSNGLSVSLHVAPRIVMSDMWNALIPLAKGDLLMLAGDDSVFQTKGWDAMVHEYFESLPDKIAYAFGDDGSPRGKVFGTHGIVHRRWVEILGYFTARGYSADYADAWPNEVAEMVGRLKCLPFVAEHLHPVWQKAPYDEVYRETNARLHRDNTPQKFRNELPMRQAEAEKLRPFLGTPYEVSISA